MKLLFSLSFFFASLFVYQTFTLDKVSFFSLDSIKYESNFKIPAWVSGKDFFLICIKRAEKIDNKESTKQNNQKNFLVRVLLHEKNSEDIFIWTLNNKKGFIISDIKTGKRFRYEHQTLTIESKSGSLYCNNKKIIAPIVKVDPLSELLSFDKKEYQGSFLVIQDNNKFFLINMLDLEDYIYSVLRSESWPGWPLEVNKAFAIACRSYLAAKVLESKKNKTWYHIKNTNLHQTYQGYHQSPILKKAVEETQGVILGYKKKPIVAMFDCCCGSIIPAHIEGIDFQHKPYLARIQECTFCKPCKIYSWKIEYTIDEFKEMLAESGVLIDTLHEVAILKKDAAGVVHKIGITTDKEKHVFSGKEFYSLISKIKSYCYDIEKIGKKIIIKGKGYGHHLGICQWGARNMVAAGWDFQKVLKFYYPGSVFMKLKTII